MQEEPGTVFRIASPMRGLTQRFAFLLLLGTAFGLLMLGRTNSHLFEEARISVIDAASPLLDVLSRPVATVHNIIDEINELIQIRTVNVSLKAENARLLELEHTSRTLLEENKQLRKLLNFAIDGSSSSVTARVIGDAIGPFVRSLLVNTGRNDGVTRGNAAVTSGGLLGRVISTGDNSSRVLLLSDLNSRIPVLIERSRARAILAGDNTKRPRLMFLSANTDLKVGSRIVTSGHGGMFPTGLPIGVVAEIGLAGIRIETFANPDQLEFIRLINYGLSGLIEDDQMTQLQGANLEK